jgi:hypothetical protein
LSKESAQNQWYFEPVAHPKAAHLEKCLDQFHFNLATFVFNEKTHDFSHI